MFVFFGRMSPGPLGRGTARKAGEVDAALELLDRMESSGGVRDPSPYNQVPAGGDGAQHKRRHGLN